MSHSKTDEIINKSDFPRYLKKDVFQSYLTGTRRELHLFRRREIEDFSLATQRNRDAEYIEVVVLAVEEYKALCQKASEGGR